MMRAVLIVAALAVLVVGVGQIFAQDKNKEKITRPEVKKEWMDLPMKKWEYKVVHVERDQAKMEEALNKLGEQGWEYVGTVSWVVPSAVVLRTPQYTPKRTSSANAPNSA